MSQINQYVDERTNLQDGDLFDIDATNGGNGYNSMKVSWDTIKAAVPSTNIGNSNLTVDEVGFRDLTLGGTGAGDGFRILNTSGNSIFKVQGNKTVDIDSNALNIGEAGASNIVQFKGNQGTISASSASFLNLVTGHRIAFKLYGTVMAQMDSANFYLYNNIKITSSKKYDISGAGFHDTNLGGALATDGWRVTNTSNNPILEVLGNSETKISDITGDNIAHFKGKRVEFNTIAPTVDMGFSFYGNGSYEPIMKMGGANGAGVYFNNYKRQNPNPTISSAFQISHYTFAGDDGAKMNFNQPKSVYGTFSGFNFLCPDTNTAEPTDADRVAWISKDGTLGMFNQAGSNAYTQKADSFEMYAKDIVAGNSAPHFRTENGDLIKLYTQDLPTNPTNAEIATFLSNLGLANLI